MSLINKYNKHVDNVNNIRSIAASGKKLSERKQKKLLKSFDKSLDLINTLQPRIEAEIKANAKFKKDVTDIWNIGAITSWII